jgi:hypothetical protein
MTINLTLSNTAGGSSLGDTVDMGSAAPGGSPTTGGDDFQDIFISHDAQVEAITDCTLYATRYAGSNYLGSDADDDLTELLSWGDSAVGGIKYVMDGWGSWVTGTKNSTGTWYTIKNGYGDVDSQILLSTDAVTTGTPAADGEIPVGGEAHVQISVDVPNPLPAPGGAGYRAFSIVFAYSATS